MEISEGTRKSARTAIQKIAKTFNINIVDVMFCAVNSVDSTARTCIVTPVSGRSSTSIEGVLLSPDKNDGQINIPTVDSTVAVAISNDFDPFIIAWSDLDAITFKGGNFGGLTKTVELKIQLDKVNAQLQAVISSLTNWTPVPNDGAAALKTYFAGQIAGKVAGDFSNIENTTIKHGNK